jgi:hypothetical protein
MTKQNAIKKLTANGYTVTKCFSGNLIATRFSQTYKASSLNALIKLLF